jgi:hypothetical protein
MQSRAVIYASQVFRFAHTTRRYPGANTEHFLLECRIFLRGARIIVVGAPSSHLRGKPTLKHLCQFSRVS